MASPAVSNLPKKPASLLKNILSKDGDDAIIKFDDRSAEIQFTDGVMRCRLIDGRYPNYNSVIPNNPNEVTVDKARAPLVVKEHRHDEHQNIFVLRLFCRNDDSGTAWVC